MAITSPTTQPLTPWANVQPLKPTAAPAPTMTPTPTAPKTMSQPMTNTAGNSFAPTGTPPGGYSNPSNIPWYNGTPLPTTRTTTPTGGWTGTSISHEAGTRATTANPTALPFPGATSITRAADPNDPAYRQAMGMPPMPGFTDMRSQTISGPTAGSVSAQNPTPTYGALDKALQTSTSPMADQLRTMGMTSLQGLSSAPNRAELAAQALQLQREMTQPAFDQDMRRVGQMASAFGRTGAGMTTNELTDLALAREKYLGQYGRDAALQAAGLEMSDRLGIFDRTAGYGSQIGSQDMERGRFGQSIANNKFDVGSVVRDQNVGERNFQYGAGMDRTGLAERQQGRQDQQAQQAIDNARMMALLEEQLANGQFGRELSAAELAMRGGNMNDPYSVQMTGAGMASDRAGQSAAAIAEQARYDAMQRALAAGR